MLERSVAVREVRAIVTQQKLIEPVELSVSKDSLPEDLRLQIDLRFSVDDAIDGGEDAHPTPTKAELIRLASAIYRARRSRAKMLIEELFGEPAWDMILALYCLPARGERLSVTGLSYAANVAPTTGLRVQAALAEKGLIEKEQEKADARRFLVSLTEKGRTLLECYLASLLCSNLTRRTFQKWTYP